jgi:hypothetical protein
MKSFPCRGAEVDPGVFAGCRPLGGVACPVCNDSGNEQCAICEEAIDESDKGVNSFLYWRWHVRCTSKVEASALVVKIRAAITFVHIQQSIARKKQPV